MPNRGAGDAQSPSGGPAPGRERSRARLIAIRAALVLVSLSLGAIVVELAVRGALDVYRCDEHMGWTFQSDRVGFKLNRESRSLTSVRLDSNGFRGPDRSLEKAPGVHRTLILGDSFTAGLHVAEAEAYPAKLQAKLTARSPARGPGGTAFEVINAGVPGYSTAQELALFREVGWKLQPDLVVLAVYLGNDIANNSIRAVPCHYLVSICGRPFFDMRDGRLDPIAGGEPQRVQAGAGAGNWAQRILASSLIYRSFFHRMHAPVSAEPAEGQVVYGIESNTRGFPSWVTTMELVIQIQKAVEVYGIPFVVLIVPTRPEVVPAPATLSFEVLRARFIGFLTEREIPYIDPLGELLRSQETGHPPYYENDHHWNEVGHAAAADAADAFLADNCQRFGIPLDGCPDALPGSPDPR